MKSKTLTTYLIKLVKVDKNQKTRSDLSTDELTNIFEGIKKLPPKIDHEPSRYDKLGSDEGRCLIFKEDKSSLQFKSYNGFICGVFAHRRNNFPYQDDGEGNIQKLQLDSEKNVVAEITYFLINKKNSVMVWVTNKFASSLGVFCQYLNNRIKEVVRQNWMQPLMINEKPAHVDYYFIIRKNSLSEFHDHMWNISSLVLKIKGKPHELENLIGHGADTGKELVGLAEICKNSGTYNLELKLTTGNKKNKLRKDFINNLFNKLKPVLKENEDKIEVKGFIDDQTRTIDLLSDKFLQKTQIQYEGKYPDSAKIFERLYNIYLSAEAELEEEQ
ncbi:MAG: hypothetical protein Kow0037_00880 [Calditrichia bacterium]